MKKKFRSIAVLAVAAMCVSMGGQAAMADNVQNDVTAGGNDTIAAGGSSTVSYRIAANNGDGQNGCNADASTPATVSINAPAGVTASPSSLTFSACGTDQGVLFGASGPGNYEITVTVSDSGAGTYNLNPAKFTLHVVAASDSTPPVIAPAVSGTLGGQGWYTSDVTVSWMVTDPESTVTSATGCGTSVVTADTAGSTFTCTATSSGGTTSQSVTIKRDATAPTLTAALDRETAATGWFNASTGAPTVAYSCADAMSGLAGSCPASHLFGEGADQHHDATVYDNAGNAASASVTDIDVDLTPPTVSLVGGPAADASYYFGSVPAAPTCTASDQISGLNGDCMVSGYAATVGTHTVAASVTDLAGNSADSSVSYTVLAWTLNGFFQPVDMSGVSNTVKNGSTVPLKFEVFAGVTELTETAAVKSLTYAQTACSTSPITDEIEAVATGSTSLRYDTTGGQFIYNWKTPSTAGKCYRVTMTTQDDSSLVAYFKLR